MFPVQRRHLQSQSRVSFTSVAPNSRQLTVWHSCDGWLRWRLEWHFAYPDQPPLFFFRLRRFLFCFWIRPMVWSSPPDFTSTTSGPFLFLIFFRAHEFSYSKSSLHPSVPLLKANRSFFLYQEISAGENISYQTYFKQMPSKEFLGWPRLQECRRALSPEKGIREFFHC